MTPAQLDQQITFLYTHDLEAASKFYADCLGLEMVLDQGLCRIFRVTESAFLGVCACREGRAVAPAGVVVSLVTADVDGWYDRLHAAGVTIDAPPRYSEKFRVYGFFAHDPEGYRVEFQSFDRPDWAAPQKAETAE
jgi:predicted enzyme related to lactoylglutathione lyase